MKKTVLLITTAFITTVALTQPRIKHQGVIGGNEIDQFSSMYLTKDGGLIVSGTSNSNISDQKTQNSRGDGDYWIVKLDSNRKIQWDKTIGGSSSDFSPSLRQTSDGGYILGGTSSSNTSGEKTQNSKGYNDYWIVKLDSAGNIQWDKTIGGIDYDGLTDLQQTSDGGYILGGVSYSNKSGDKTENRKSKDSYSDYWIVKLDASGSIEWDKTIGGNGSDDLHDLQQTADGGYILGGTSGSTISGDRTQRNRGSDDYWIVKLDAAGSIEWDKAFGGTQTDFFESLQQTADDGYILGGASFSNKSHEKSQNSRGLIDYWIIKLDVAGNIQWDKTIGGNNTDFLRTLQQTSDGGYILGGESLSPISGEKTENGRGDTDYWIVKLNSNGKVQWDKTIGGSNEDACYAVSEIKKNHYVVGGYSYSGISGDKTGGNRGKVNKTADYWLVELRYVKPDSVSIAQVPASKLAAPAQNANNTFSVYPNPATTQLHIQNKGKATFILTDQSGKRLLAKTMEGNGDLNVANVPAGTYYLTNTTTKTTQRIVITK